MKRRIVILAVVLFLAGVVTVAWTLAGLPPAKFYLRYGLDPSCEPTGEKDTWEGVEFVQIGPGVFRMGSTANAEGGDWLGKLCKPFGLPCATHAQSSEPGRGGARQAGAAPHKRRSHQDGHRALLISHRSVPSTQPRGDGASGICMPKC